MKSLYRLFVLVVLVGIALCGAVRAEHITLAATEWEPYTGSKLEAKGFLAELATMALARVGYTSEIKIMPWSRALDETKKGHHDGLIGASYTEERTKYFTYSVYAWISAMHFFTSQNNSAVYTSPEALCPAKLGMLRGSFYVDRFKDSCFETELSNDVTINIKKLDGGRIDYFINARDSVLYLLNKYYPDANVRMVEPAYEQDSVHIVFSKLKDHHKELANALDKGMKLIQADGTYDAILKKHGVK